MLFGRSQNSTERISGIYYYILDCGTYTLGIPCPLSNLMTYYPFGTAYLAFSDDPDKTFLSFINVLDDPSTADDEFYWLSSNYISLTISQPLFAGIT